MTKSVLARLLSTAVLVVAFVSNAHAGFTISVKPLPKPVPAPVVMAPGVASVVAPAAPVTVMPVIASSASPMVQMKVGKGESLQVAVKEFLSPFGWTPAWMAGEVLSGDAMTFQGKDHEEALSAFLRHYNLVGERFAADKGYVIRRNSETGAKAK